jgi:hypothetical protein
MNQRIIYQNNEGGVSVIIPTGEIAIEEVARKDVPVGVAYKIVDVADIPEDRTFRAAWEADITEPDGVGIGADAWFAEQEVKKLEAENDNNQPE